MEPRLNSYSPSDYKPDPYFYTKVDELFEYIELLEKASEEDSKPLNFN